MPNKPEQGEGGTSANANKDKKVVKQYLKDKRKPKGSETQAGLNARIDAEIDAAQDGEIGWKVAKLHGMTPEQWREARAG